jgi:hypothetical protein
MEVVEQEQVQFDIELLLEAEVVVVVQFDKMVVQKYAFLELDVVMKEILRQVKAFYQLSIINHLQVHVSVDVVK